MGLERPTRSNVEDLDAPILPTTGANPVTELEFSAGRTVLDGRAVLDSVVGAAHAAAGFGGLFLRDSHVELQSEILVSSHPQFQLCQDSEPGVGDAFRGSEGIWRTGLSGHAGNSRGVAGNLEGENERKVLLDNQGKV